MRPYLPFLLAAACTSTTSLAWADELHPAESEASATEWNSKPMGITGIALAGTGALGVTFGALMAARPSEMCVVDNDHTSCEIGPERAIGGVMIATGGAMLLAGIPMIVAGAWQVRADDAGAPPTTAALRVGAGRADLAVSF